MQEDERRTLNLAQIHFSVQQSNTMTAIVMLDANSSCKHYTGFPADLKKRNVSDTRISFVGSRITTLSATGQKIIYILCVKLTFH